MLTKQPKGKEIEPSDAFVFNAAFDAPKFRIKINTIQLRETVEETAKINEAVTRDRQYQIDAALVRLMKVGLRVESV